MYGGTDEYRVVQSATAHQELDAIVDYLARYYPSTPGKFLRAMEQFKVNVSFMPRMYKVAPENSEYHRAVVGKYLVYYEINDEKKLVTVRRVLYGAANIPKHLV